MQSRSHAKYSFLRIGVGSFDGVRDFNAHLCKNIETTSLFNRFQSEIRCSCIFLFGGREGDFLGGGSFKGKT